MKIISTFGLALMLSFGTANASPSVNTGQLNVSLASIGATVQGFAENFLTDTFTISFGYEPPSVSSYFEDKESFDAFENVFRQSGLYDYVKKNQSITNIDIHKTKIYETEFGEEGIHVWSVQIDYSMEFQAAQTMGKQSFAADIDIVRRPGFDTNGGLVIRNIIVRRVPGGV